MFRKMMIVISALAIMMTLVSCQRDGVQATLATPPPKAAPEGQVLTLGEISSDPATKYEEIDALIKYLTAQLADDGITRVEVVVTTDFETMMDHLETGEVDLFFDHVYAALVANDEVGARLLLRRWRKGASEYHSTLIATKDSGITTVDDLLGQVVALDKPDSSTGDTMPRAYLMSLGYELVLKTSADSPVSANQVGYAYAESDDNILAWVLEGKAACGSLENIVYEGLDDDVKSQLTVVAETPDVPRHVVMASPKLDAALEARIVEVLANMHLTDEGKAALKDFGKTDQFDELPLGPEGTMEMLHELFEPVR